MRDTVAPARSIASVNERDEKDSCTSATDQRGSDADSGFLVVGMR